MEADRVDPDVDEDDPDRDEVPGVTAHGQGEGNGVVEDSEQSSRPRT